MQAHQLGEKSEKGKRSRHEDLELMSDIMMLKIAEILPAEYRGDFTPEGVVKRYQERAARKNSGSTALKM